LASLSATEHVQLVRAEILPSERVGATEGYEAAYRRALVKRAKAMGIKLD